MEGDLELKRWLALDDGTLSLSPGIAGSEEHFLREYFPEPETQGWIDYAIKQLQCNG